MSAIHFRKQAATDGTKLDLNIGETRVWRLDSGPNLQPCKAAVFHISHSGLASGFLLPGGTQVTRGMDDWHDEDLVDNVPK